MRNIDFLHIDYYFEFLWERKEETFILKKRISYLDFLPLFYGNRMVRSHKGFKTIPRLNTDDFYLLFQDREIELREHFKMHPGETFVDVGCNVGFYSLLLAKLKPGITIISIEVHPDTFEALNKNIKINSFKNIISINKAISSHNREKLRLYQYWTEKGQKNSGMSDLSNRHHAKSFKETPCDSLDNLLKSIDNTIYVIKIDIEGEEVNTLLGAKNTLKKTRKIIVETHSQDNLKQVKQILSSYQFNIEIVKSSMTFVIGTK